MSTSPMYSPTSPPSTSSDGSDSPPANALESLRRLKRKRAEPSEAKKKKADEALKNAKCQCCDYHDEIVPATTKEHGKFICENCVDIHTCRECDEPFCYDKDGINYHECQCGFNVDETTEEEELSEEEK